MKCIGANRMENDAWKAVWTPTASSHIARKSFEAEITSALKSFHRERAFAAIPNDSPTWTDIRDARLQIHSNASSGFFKEYQVHVDNELAKECNRHTLDVKCMETAFFRFQRMSLENPISSKNLSNTSAVSSEVWPETSLRWRSFKRVRWQIPPSCFTVRKNILVHVASAFVETFVIGQSVVSLFLGNFRMESQIDEITTPKFISLYLIRSYQYLFNRHFFAAIPEHNQPRDSSTQWKSRAEETQSLFIEFGELRRALQYKVLC